MKRVILVLVFLLAVVSLAAQQAPRQVTVKSTETNSGVLIVKVDDGRHTLELQCNKGMPDCTTLRPGPYQMLELPKNHGLYDCMNVELYGEEDTQAKGRLMGAYCLTQR